MLIKHVTPVSTKISTFIIHLPAISKIKQ